jgi:hypothetical protein
MTEHELLYEKQARVVTSDPCPGCAKVTQVLVSIRGHVPAEEIKLMMDLRHDEANPRCPFTLARKYERAEPILKELFIEARNSRDKTVAILVTQLYRAVDSR